jgi:hypothetical protein
MTAHDPTSARLVYLDWLRVAAFGLLILYHVGMFYVTWDWHVKSDRAGPAIQPLMLFTNPWRLTLLFFVSGAATRFMADKMAPGRLAGRRTVRLLVPLLFAMFVIVPPQGYYEVVEQLGYTGSYLDFMGRYLAADGICRDGDCLEVPTWNHLWFVAYLFVYSLVLAAALALFPKALRAAGARIARAPAWALLAAPIVYLGLARLVLFPMFEVTHALVDDWYNHAVSFAAFLLGFLIMKEERATAAFVRLRWPALLLFAGAYVALMTYIRIYPFEGPPPPDWLWDATRFVYAADQWAAIVAALGFGALHLNRDSRLLRTLTVAVFPFYIAHQTIIVVAGHHLNRLRLPLLVEAGLLIGVTALGCGLTFEIARRVDLLRPLFGLGPRPRSAPPLEAPAALS